MSNRVGWLVSLILVACLAAPLWAEDDGGAPPQGEGVYDMQGGFLGRNMEEAQATAQAQAQAERQAQLEAFAATHPAPADGSGLHDAQGNYLGANLREAAEAGNIPPQDLMNDALVQHHGLDKVYVNPETGDTGVYMNQQGQVISQEQFLADMERFKNEAIAGARRVIEGGSGDLNVNVLDDVQVQEAVNASRSALEKQEAGANADLQRQQEEAKRYVPARTLRSFEANSSQGK